MCRPREAEEETEGTASLDEQILVEGKRTFQQSS